jgi:hypothetical protein
MHKLMFLFGVVASLHLGAHAQVVTNGLIAYYPFNGNGQDESLNNYHGEIGTATLTTDRFGIANAAYMFNSTVSDTIGFDVPFSSGNFSITYWMMPDYWGDGTGNNIPMVVDWRNKMQNNAAFSVNLFSDTSVRFLLRDEYNQNQYTALFVNSILSLKRETRWIHVAFVYEHPQMRIYANGQLIDDANSNYTNSFNFNRLLLARNFYQNLQPTYNTKYTGKIDDIYIFNRAIDSNEIVSIYTETPDTSTTATIKYFNNKSVNIYPNPGNNHFFVDFKALKTNKETVLLLMDMMGRTVWKKETSEKFATIDAANLVNGNYLLQLRDKYSGEKMAQKALIKF